MFMLFCNHDKALIYAFSTCALRSSASLVLEKFWWIQDDFLRKWTDGPNTFFTCAFWSSKLTRVRAPSFSDREAWQTDKAEWNQFGLGMSQSAHILITWYQSTKLRKSSLVYRQTSNLQNTSKSILCGIHIIENLLLTLNDLCDHILLKTIATCAFRSSVWLELNRFW